MQVQYWGVTVIRHAHFWPGRAGHRVRYVVGQGTASPDMATAEAVARYFQTTTRETGTHYVVGKDGAVVQCVREEDSAWGNGIVTAGHEPRGGRRRQPHPANARNAQPRKRAHKAGAANSA